MTSNYQKSTVWQKSFQLTVEIYNITKNFPQEELFGLPSQMRRCAISIPSNIAEGNRRSSKKEFSHFLSISRGSCNELETQILLAKSLEYIDGKTEKKLLQECNEIVKILSKLITKF